MRLLKKPLGNSLLQEQLFSGCHVQLLTEMRFCVQHFKASLMAKTKGYLRLCKQQPLAYKPAFPEMIQQMVPTCCGGVKPWVSVAELHYSFTRALLSLVVFDSDILHSLATRKTCNKGLGVSQISWKRFILNPKNCQARQVELPCDPMMWGTWSRDVEEWSPWIGSFFFWGGEIWEKHSNHHFLRVKRHLGRRNSKTLHVGRKPATVPSVVDRRSFFHAVFLGALAYLNLFDAHMQPMYYGSCELLSCK